MNAITRYPIITVAGQSTMLEITMMDLQINLVHELLFLGSTS
jgi:hypothetical protein